MKSDWNENYVSKIKCLKNLSETQQLIILLFEKGTLAKDEDYQLNLLLKAERAKERARIAEIDAANLINHRKETDRKEKNYQLMKFGLMVEKAGLTSRSPTQILGCLLSMNTMENGIWEQMRTMGEKYLEEHGD